MGLLHYAVRLVNVLVAPERISMERGLTRLNLLHLKLLRLLQLNHATIVAHVEVLLRDMAVLSRDMMQLIMGLGRLMINCNWLGSREMMRCSVWAGLTGLWSQAERLRQRRRLHVLNMRSCQVMVLMGGLVLLSYSLETLFKNLDHMVTLLLLIDKFFVKDLIDTRDRFFDFGEHQLKFTLELWHDMISHCLLELMVDYLSD